MDDPNPAENPAEPASRPSPDAGPGSSGDAGRLQSLELRLELLERENQRMRDKLTPFVGPDNPSFDVPKFRRALVRILLVLALPLMCLELLIPIVMIPLRSLRALHIVSWQIGGIRVFDLAGIHTHHQGLGFGLIALGGVSVGIVAVGGLAIGLIAVGGGSIGILAVGGGSIGVIAIGGGSFGIVAIGGGGAVGHYALGQRAYGKFALGINRQDPQAIEFFVRYFPILRDAITMPFPVIPIAKAHDASGIPSG